jgi:hypothetical protein
MAEEITGRIFSKDEAASAFGNVALSIHLSSSLLLSLCSKTNKYLMFNIKSGGLSVLGDSRILLYPESFNVDASEIYAVYSKTIIEELLESGGEDVTFIEQRKEVLSLTNGAFTLEMGSWCPPLCS